MWIHWNVFTLIEHAVALLKRNALLRDVAFWALYQGNKSDFCKAFVWTTALRKRQRVKKAPVIRDKAL